VSTPTDEQAQGIWLTQEAHDRLKAELDQLVAGRPAMSAEINARRRTSRASRRPASVS
jgi:transcription elongation factor GreA